MRRREFISGLTAAAMWPLAARAQQPRTPVVGLLNGVAFEGPYASAIASIRRGLQETGLVEGQDFAIEYRAAGGRYERLPDLAADLVRSHVAVIVAIGASMPALADAASSTPIVFALGSDAVEVGVLNGLNRPEASMTGANFASAGPASERLALLLELRPGAPLVGYLDNSRLSATFEINVENLTTAARLRGRDLVVFDAGTDQEIETAFTQMALQRVRALIISPDPFLTARQEQIIAFAAQTRLATIYPTRGAVMLGGLMSYGAVTNDMYRAAGIYAGRILKGATPAELPIMLPTRFELVINNKTASALRIPVPRRLIARADEIID
ncbi:MAG TPA: ABC transporter substrate-binding protein [Xanthobacteraceae bacterium]|jgi:putative ABC transport system substrate-binding protein|nr:ABC transporter substrate-binding protein [Xanthobacteraceae bacterium]